MTYAWSSLWKWNSGNFITDDKTGNLDYVWNETLQGWHYDPINAYSGTNRSVQCQPGENIIACPAQIQLPFFNAYNLIATLVVIVLIYILINSASKKKPVKRKKKRK